MRSAILFVGFLANNKKNIQLFSLIFSSVSDPNQKFNFFLTFSTSLNSIAVTAAALHIAYQLVIKGCYA